MGMELPYVVLLDNESTLNFFFHELEDVQRPGLTDKERAYVASVLAHYAQTSMSDASDMPLFSSLFQVLDTFILASSVPRDPRILELAGSQTLLLAGFFRDQTRRRNNPNLYDRYGSIFYGEASLRLAGIEREVFSRISRNFPTWTKVCRDLSRNFRANQDNRFLLR